MTLPPWNRSLLAVALLLAGCKSNPPPPAPAAAGSTSAPVTNAAPPPPAASALTEPALTYFKAGDGPRCSWIHQPLSSGIATPLFSFESGCDRVEFSWSPQGKEGLVLDASSGAAQRLLRVDFAAKAGKPVPLQGLPPGTGGTEATAPFIRKAGFDAQGRPVVIVQVRFDAPEGEEGARFLSYEGQRYPITQDVGGVYQLVLGYRWEGTEWKRVEAKVTGDASELDTAKSLYAPGVLSNPEPPGQALAGAEAQRLSTTFSPKDRHGKWMALSTPGVKVVYRAQQKDADEDPSPTTPIRWMQGDTLEELEGLTVKNGTSLVIQQRDALLNLNTDDSGVISAYVFDTRTKKNLLSVKGLATNATLWPEPSKP